MRRVARGRASPAFKKASRTGESASLLVPLIKLYSSCTQPLLNRISGMTCYRRLNRATLFRLTPALAPPTPFSVTRYLFKLLCYYIPPGRGSPSTVYHLYKRSFLPNCRLPLRCPFLSYCYSLLYRCSSFVLPPVFLCISLVFLSK